MRTIACITCGTVTPARCNRQKYCGPCGEAAKAMRKHLYEQARQDRVSENRAARHRPCCKCGKQSGKDNPAAIAPYLCGKCRKELPRSISCSCSECGIKFPADTLLRKKCDICSALADGLSLVCPLPRACECCGATFTPSSGRQVRQRFCGKKCKDKKARLPNTTCPVCRKGFYKRAAQPNRKTCSARCWSALVSRKRGPVSVTRYRAACDKCGVLHWSNILNKVRCDACKRAPAYLEPRNCTICGVLWQPLVRNAFGHRGLCGEASCLAAHEELVRQRKRDGRNRSRRIHGNKSTHRKRARHYGVYYEPIDVKFVFNRDRWHCKICGVSTPKRLRGSCEPNAPELDHIIPLSLGGAHAYDNVQCACRACNGAKGNSKAIGQLLMFAAA